MNTYLQSTLVITGHSTIDCSQLRAHVFIKSALSVSLFASVSLSALVRRRLHTVIDQTMGP